MNSKHYSALLGLPYRLLGACSDSLTQNQFVSRKRPWTGLRRHLFDFLSSEKHCTALKPRLALYRHSLPTESNHVLSKHMGVCSTMGLPSTHRYLLEPLRMHSARPLQYMLSSPLCKVCNLALTLLRSPSLDAIAIYQPISPVSPCAAGNLVLMLSHTILRCVSLLRPCPCQRDVFGSPCFCQSGYEYSRCLAAIPARICSV